MQTSHRELRFWALPGLLAFIYLIWLFSQDGTKCICISMCLGLAIPHIQGCEIAAVNSICGWVAKYSYGIYLLHDPAIWLGFVRFGRIPTVAKIGIFLLTTLGGSVLVYFVNEHPMIFLGSRIAATMSQTKTLSKGRALAATAGITD